MEMYLLKSAACLAFLMLFYKLLLERESIHLFKRWYLLGAVIFSAVIPLITFHTYIEASPLLTGQENMFVISQVASDESSQWLYPMLWFIYLTGAFLFFGKFLWNLFALIVKIRKHQKVRTQNFSAVLLPEDLPPHTFWSYIFLNRQKYEKGQIPMEVLEHEKAHALQKHSFDILFLELLQVFFWFNPLIYLVKKAVRLNHEFLADSAVLKRGANTAAYQELLLSFSSKDLQSGLINSINYSLIKKRFTVMKTRTSKTTSAFKAFLLLPLLAALLYSFSTKEIILQERAFEEIETPQEKATPQMVAEYNKLAKRYRKEQITEVTVQEKDFKRMMYIFGLMTEDQRKDAEKLPPPPPPARITEDIPPPPPPVTKDGDVPPPPPPPPAPKVDRAGEVSPPPPPPPSPIEAVKGWVEEGAVFFYNGNSISGKEALEIVQKNKGRNLSVDVQKNNSKKTVRLSDKKQ